jgi:hypothetical protein
MAGWEQHSRSKHTARSIAVDDATVIAETSQPIMRTPSDRLDRSLAQR